MNNNGFYVMTFGGGRYTSIAWTLTREEAQREVDQIKACNSWSGMPPKIVPAGPQGQVLVLN